MSKKKIAGIIAGCAVAIIVIVVVATYTPTHTLSVSLSPSGAGSVSPAGGQYKSGEQVILAASPASGYTFDYWWGSASGSSPTITVTMDSDKSITANFKTAIQTYTLTTNVSPAGAGSVSPSGDEYESGSQVTLTANPATGHTFDHWSGDASGSTTTVTITMDSDKTITAHFEVENRSPIIVGITPDPWDTVADKSTMIGTSLICEAYDPDGDTISYTWIANEGTITGTGVWVRWLIPAEPGRYVITLTVDDGKEGESSASATVDFRTLEVIGDTFRYDYTWTFSYEHP
jgi:uncharacterized repeat protein (TIGR02543 family)